ncbi:hypothetical protein ACFWJW_20705 [Streptomyces sp. NPDC127097]|uniref:hypothetical protein n=1 Tax=Streptomyces sp. NPDC127097 TaxID=3347136 RepID=UPI003658D52C
MTPVGGGHPGRTRAARSAETLRASRAHQASESATPFIMDTEGLRVALNHGLPAAIYLLVGHLIAGRVRRL